MDSTGFNVTPSELKRSAGVIDEKTSRYEAEYNRIYSEIANLRVQWKGQTSDSFNNQLEGYRGDFQKLGKIMNDYSKFLRQAADKYVAGDNRLADDAQRLRSGK